MGHRARELDRLDGPLQLTVRVADRLAVLEADHARKLVSGRDELVAEGEQDLEPLGDRGSGPVVGG